MHLTVSNYIKITMVRAVEKAYERFIRIRGNPKEIALGFALGLFIGVSPTMGIQILIAIFIASILKWNKYAAAIGVWITNPLTAPFIYSLTYLTGTKITGIQNSLKLTGNFDWDTLIDLFHKSPGIMTALVVGGVFVGLPLAVTGYFLAFTAVENYQKRLKEKLREKKEKLKQKVKQRKQHKAAFHSGNKRREVKDISKILPPDAPGQN